MHSVYASIRSYHLVYFSHQTSFDYSVDILSQIIHCCQHREWSQVSQNLSASLASTYQMPTASSDPSPVGTTNGVFRHCQMSLTTSYCLQWKTTDLNCRRVQVEGHTFVLSEFLTECLAYSRDLVSFSLMKEWMNWKSQN